MGGAALFDAGVEIVVRVLSPLVSLAAADGTSNTPPSSRAARASTITTRGRMRGDLRLFSGRGVALGNRSRGMAIYRGEVYGAGSRDGTGENSVSGPESPGFSRLPGSN